MLQVKPTRPLNSTLCALIHAVDCVAKKLEMSYFVIGATARDILLEHVYGLDTTRATRDVDFAVAVSSWEQFFALKDELIASGAFVAGISEQRLDFFHTPAIYPLDLVPFSGIEENGTIAWPPRGDFVMNVSGYAEAYECALDIEIEPGLQVKVVSLPSIVVLKILAWNDKPEREKHASDVLLILRSYHQAGQFDRLYDDARLLEALDYDLELVGAALLGRDAKRDSGPDSCAQVTALFRNERKLNRFTAQMTRSQRGAPMRVAQLLNAFLAQLA